MFHYIKIADMLKQIIQKKKQLKHLIYNDKQLPSTKIPMAYSLLSLVTNNFNLFQDSLLKISKISKEQIGNKYLMIVLMGEFINVGSIKGGGKLKKIIIQNQKLLPNIKVQSKINKQNVQIRLIETGEQFIRLSKIFKQKMLLENTLVKNMYHLNAKQYQQLIAQNPLILKSGSAVIQSFSSSLPPVLLLQDIEKYFLNQCDAIDACSAPGNKTIQLSQYIRNKDCQNRNVFAFQKDPKRFQILKKTILRFGAQENTLGKNQNFLEVKPKDQKYSKVKFILLDPSCSGSGMLTNFLRDTILNENKPSQNPQNPQNQQTFQQFCQKKYSQLPEKQKQRVQLLHDFQLQLLRHAAKFRAKRISYSTCSIYQRQNEDVVREFLQMNNHYEVKKSKLIKKNKKKYGISQGFKGYKDCVRIDPRKRESDGFFVTIFKRKKVFKKKNYEK